MRTTAGRLWPRRKSATAAGTVGGGGDLRDRREGRLGLRAEKRDQGGAGELAARRDHALRRASQALVDDVAARRLAAGDAERAAHRGEDVVAGARHGARRCAALAPPLLWKVPPCGRGKIARRRPAAAPAAGARKRPRERPARRERAIASRVAEPVERGTPGEEAPEREAGAHRRRRQVPLELALAPVAHQLRQRNPASGRRSRSGRRRSRRWAGARPCRRRSATASAPRPSAPDRPSRKRGRRPRDRPGNGSCRRRSGCSAACPGTRCRAWPSGRCRAGRRDILSGPSGSPARRGPVENVV